MQMGKNLFCVALADPEGYTHGKIVAEDMPYEGAEAVACTISRSLGDDVIVWRQSKEHLDYDCVYRNGMKEY